MGEFGKNIEGYVAGMSGFLNTSTIGEHGRKIRRFAKIFDELLIKGIIKTDCPEKIGEPDIGAFLQWMRENDIDVATQAKYVQILNRYLLYHDNHIIAKLKNTHRFPSPPRKPIKALTVEDIQRIFDGVAAMTGWDGILARGVVALAFETLGRPTELRLALIQDLDLTTGRFYIRRPKGEHSYASSQWVDLLRPDVRPMLENYIIERGAYLQEKGITSQHLFPNVRTGGGEYSANAIRRRIRNIREIVGVDFVLKDFRATGVNFFVSVDRNLLNAMSAQLRHTDIGTTQRYYADIRSGRVADDLGGAWRKTKITVCKSLIGPAKHHE